MRIDGEWWAAAVALVMAGVGWGIHSTLLALAGTLGALTAVLLWVWVHECLTGVTYRRTLAQQRAVFGEEVAMDVEIVNDKLLPLTWLHVADEVPPALTVHGGTVLPGRSGLYSELHHLLPLLPYQRVRRRLTVVCNSRGAHTFGPTSLRSGNPVGYREQFARVRDCAELLVYPKVFRLAYPALVSRMPLGEHRALRDSLRDPSRPAGVREYRAGDPLRHVDWRATARSTALLVRVHEPTAALRVAVFSDLSIPRSGEGGSDHEIAEFAIAVTASVVTDLSHRGAATGLYSSGDCPRSARRQESEHLTGRPAFHARTAGAMLNLDCDVDRRIACPRSTPAARGQCGGDSRRLFRYDAGRFGRTSAIPACHCDLGDYRPGSTPTGPAGGRVLGGEVQR